MSSSSEPRSAPAESFLDALWAVFGVPLRRQTYGNLVYLTLQFPLGVAYFTTFISLLTLSAGLSVVLVGVPLLIGTLVLVTGVVSVETVLADTLLSADVDSRSVAIDLSDGVLTYAKELVLDVGTYVSLAFLLTKLFVGVVSFTLLTFLFSLTGGLLTAPLLYDRPGSYRVFYNTTLTFAPEVRFVQDLWSITFAPVITLSEWNVDTLAEALIVAAFGLVMLVISLHVLNGVARVLGSLTALVLRHARSLDL
ncbi:sensor domain-containing protein [Halorubrum halophilum]|uniref:sensor domain-containing protein n=1 Tax=Halorubrum halophilum TaxID=413816 RepID=UPI00186ACC19|nr:sensor domain-containing protein [Halorubrum halophilum]